MSDEDDRVLLDMHRADLTPVTVILRTANTKRETPLETNWKRAFLVLVMVLAREWLSSSQLSLYVDAVRAAAGDEPADLMVVVINRLRTPFMQRFMG